MRALILYAAAIITRQLVSIYALASHDICYFIECHAAIYSDASCYLRKPATNAASIAYFSDTISRYADEPPLHDISNYIILIIDDA